MATFLDVARLKEGLEWHPFPAWAAFYFKLGTTVGKIALESGRIVTAVATPIRDFAAALTATGIVLTRVSAMSVEKTADEHFNALCRLGPGTAVTLERDSRQFPGILTSIVTLQGERYLRIQMQDQETGGEAHYVPSRECLRITATGFAAGPLPSRVRGRAAIVRRAFLRTIIGADHVRRFTRERRLECTIVGRRSVIASELLKTEISAGAESVKGKLCDIVRARELLAAGRPFRSELLAANAKKLTFDERQIPHVAVFDGPQGFIKWSHRYPNSHLIVILDKTEPRFEDAVSLINQNFSSPRNRPYTGLAINDVPNGVDLLAYRSEPR